MKGVQNPITLARAVMEQTEHVLMVGAGAERLAAQLALPALMVVVVAVDALPMVVVSVV